VDPAKMQEGLMEFYKFARDDEDTITVENASKEKVVYAVKIRECLREFNKFARDDEIQCGMCKLYDPAKMQ
jgi:hypothetical protein